MKPFLAVRPLVLAVAVPLFLALCASTPLVSAQESDATEKPAAKKGTSKKSTGPKVRLPNYYGKVVSEKQREKILAIRAKYTERIKELRAQMVAIQKEMNKEMQDVLSDEQKQELAEHIAAAKAKRAKKPAQEK